ncbi:nitrate ABC transporter substrate-binding protein [Pseudonocardia acaciae]|uniref:nitrate ABC transporter substrate-binding protein n=1 Tax=Pseudonocardia acaciae TaxID=551276 RepID=UPI00048F67FA|nr:nitrate ABC transporter substrate-binding protein [Pseudonocardia acaciae]
MSRVAAALAALLCAAVAGCSGAPEQPAQAAPRLPAATGAERLSYVCPATVVVQQAWEPEADHAATYQLVGPGYSIDAARKRISGPLVAGGKDTGVRIEIRPGGAAIGFGTVPAQMYLDRSITLGAVPTDLAISTSASQPVTAVVAPLAKSPMALMWDPATHPDWNTVDDIRRSGARVLMSQGNAATALLTGKGLIRPEQVDTGYTGSPVRFVTDPTIAQQAFATNEPFVYQHEVTAWRKPVRYQLIADVGFSVYPEALSVRTADLGPLSACLTRLVPLIQRAQLDYLANPGPTNKLIVDAVAAFNTGWTYSPGVADYAAATMTRLGVIANDTSGPLGGMDPTRVQATIETLAPTLARDGAGVRPGLKAGDIATTRFVNPGIRTR